MSRKGTIGEDYGDQSVLVTELTKTDRDESQDWSFEPEKTSENETVNSWDLMVTVHHLGAIGNRVKWINFVFLQSHNQISDFLYVTIVRDIWFLHVSLQ